MENYESLVVMAGLMHNTVQSDRNGLPDFFVPFLPQSLEEDAFTADGLTADAVFLAKYAGTMRMNGVYSLPLEMPAVRVNHEDALRLCLQKGIGYHMWTIAEWAMLTRRTVKGVRGFQGSSPQIAGSGPWAFAHNGKCSGLWDAAGNVSAWVSGYRTVDGEIQIIPDNDAAAATADELSASSILWRAIHQDGTLTAPGAAGTLHWGWESGHAVLTGKPVTVEDAPRQTLFSEIAADPGVQPEALARLERVGLKPEGDGTLFFNTSGERVAAAGGSCKPPEGVRVLDGRYLRGDAADTVGIRIGYMTMTA